MANKPLTEDELDAIREGHAAGKTLRAIATELGRSTSTVGKYARELGLSWDTSRTAAATEAKVATNRDRRAELETRLLVEAAKLLDQLHEPHTVYNFGGRDNTYAEHELAEPDVAAKKALVQAAGTAIDKAVRLSEVDRGTTGADTARGILGNLSDALAVAYGQLAPEDAPEGDDSGD